MPFKSSYGFWGTLEVPNWNGCMLIMIRIFSILSEFEGEKDIHRLQVLFGVGGRYWRILIRLYTLYHLFSQSQSCFTHWRTITWYLIEKITLTLNATFPYIKFAKVQSLLVHPESNTIWHRLFPFLTPLTHEFGNHVVGYVCAVVPLIP